MRANSIVCSVLLIRQSNQAVWSPSPTSPTRLCRRKLRRALSCHVHETVIHERERKKTTHSILSLSPSFSLFFPSLFSQIPTTAVPTHGKWKPNISCRFRRIQTGCCSCIVVSHLQALSLPHRVSAEKQAYTHRCHSWDAIS